MALVRRGVRRPGPAAPAALPGHLQRLLLRKLLQLEAGTAARPPTASPGRRRAAQEAALAVPPAARPRPLPEGEAGEAGGQPPGGGRVLHPPPVVLLEAFLQSLPSRLPLCPHELGGLVPGPAAVLHPREGAAPLAPAAASRRPPGQADRGGHPEPGEEGARAHRRAGTQVRQGVSS